MVFCRGCGKEIHESATACPNCGAVQHVPGQGKSKVIAAMLAIFLGGFGIHRFYLGQWWGIFYVLLCWTFVPSIVAFIEALVFLISSEASWNQKYGHA
jgi:TM2 domain-containing membrane protein YozV